MGFEKISEAWPENLYCAVFGALDYIELPFDAEDAVDYILDTMDDEGFVLLARFKHDISRKECGKLLDVTVDRVRQIEAKELRKLRHPSRSGYLLRGLEGQKLFEAERDKKIQTSTSMLDLNLLNTRLSNRAYNCLKRKGIDTLTELINWTADELRGIRNLGEHTLNEIKQVCADYGVKLKDED